MKHDISSGDKSRSKSSGDKSKCNSDKSSSTCVRVQCSYSWQ